MTEQLPAKIYKPHPKRTEPLRANRIVDTVVPEKSKNRKIRKTLGKLSLAAALIIPPADLALSDAATAKVYEIVQDNVTNSSPITERGIELSVTGLALAAESVALGQALSRNKKLHNAAADFDDYVDYKQMHMKPLRKAVSKTLNMPFIGLQKLGSAFEKAGNKVAQRKTKIAQVAGKLLVDAGQVNAIGTSGVIMEETSKGKPPNLSRQAYLAGLIATSWLGSAELIRGVYHHAGIGRIPMAAFGRAYEVLTHINVSNPVETPVGTLTIGSVIAGLAYTGWKIEDFRQLRAEKLGINAEQVQLEIADFQTS